eukprot:ctg_3782.g612
MSVPGHRQVSGALRPAAAAGTAGARRRRRPPRGRLRGDLPATPQRIPEKGRHRGRYPRLLCRAALARVLRRRSRDVRAVGRAADAHRGVSVPAGAASGGEDRGVRREVSTGRRRCPAGARAVQRSESLLGAPTPMRAEIHFSSSSPSSTAHPNDRSTA